MESFKNKLIGVFLIIATIIIVIRPFFGSGDITELIKWLSVRILVLIGVLLLIKKISLYHFFTIYSTIRSFPNL